MTANDCPIPFDDLSAAVQKSVGPDAPERVKMMTAKGVVPMQPRDLVTAQFVLTFDPSLAVAQAASEGLERLAGPIANAVLGDQSAPPAVLGYLARTLATQDAYAEKLLLNRATPIEAFVEVAKVGSERICELIADNQRRVLDQPEIARSLHDNPNALKSTVDRVIDFLVRNGTFLEGLRGFEEAFLRLNGEERIKAANNITLPEHILDDRFLTDEQKHRRLIAEEEDAGDEETEQQPLEVLLRTYNAAQKVALATKGDRAARAALMRDTNRIVALAAITSPCVSEPEVLAAASSRTVHQDVITHICRDKKNNWTRNYQVKKALVENPKTPLPEAMKLVPSLNNRDMKMVAKSRNVPVGVRNLASNILRQQRR